MYLLVVIILIVVLILAVHNLFKLDDFYTWNRPCGEYEKEDRYHNYLSCPTCLFIGGHLTKNVIIQTELKSRKHVQINKKYEVCIIDTFRSPTEALVFNPLKMKESRFYYWCWKCNKCACGNLFSNKEEYLNHLQKKRW